MQQNDDPIALFKKNAREAVGVACTEWKGEARVDLRIYVQAIDEDGLVPTKKGVGIPIEIFPQVLEGVRQLGDVMSADRLVARVPRNEKSEIRVGTNTFKGHHLIYVRVFNKENSELEESWKVTNKGVSMRVDLYPKLLEALELADRMLTDDA